MKGTLLIFTIIFAVLACGCMSQTPAEPPGTPQVSTQTVSVEKAIPDLTGIWSGTGTGHTRAEGFVSNAPVHFNITVQKGQVFSGLKEYIRPEGGTFYENFSGIVTLTGEVYESDDLRGFAFGKITGPDSMELNYLEDGLDTKAYILHLTRHKT